MKDNYEDIIYENIVLDSKIKKIDDCLYIVCKSICKIKAANSIGSGFLIKLYKENSPLYCLMTNEHVITKEMTENKKVIEIFYDNQNLRLEIKLDKEKRFIKDYLYLGIDAIIIEIIKEDNIKDNYFLSPNMEYINGYKEFENKEIYIPQYPGGEELSHSEGKIKSINNYEFSHLASTQKGSSGSPIFIKGSTTVIGIHNKSKRNKRENYGNFIGPIIESLKKNLEYDKKYNNKEIYEGEYKIGKFEGDAKYIYENGNYYIGQWRDGERYGKGTLYYKNGNIKYDGDFNFDKYEGNGKYFYEDGEYYIGQWLDGKKHGKGILFYRDDNIKYEGDFVFDEYEGNEKYENSSYSIGQLYDGIKNVLFNKNGDFKYEDYFFNYKNKGNGKRKYVYKNGDYYIGQILEGKKHGKGILYYKNGNIKYDGDFISDKFEGDGKYIYENGEYYIGQWLDGKKHGKGILFYRDGNIKNDGDFLYDKYKINEKDVLYIFKDIKYYINQLLD